MAKGWGGAEKLSKEHQVRAGGLTGFKCLKMQITTGFKFCLPPLVKTKGEVLGCQKTTELQLVFLGPSPAGITYGKKWSC